MISLRLLVVLSRYPIRASGRQVIGDLENPREPRLLQRPGAAAISAFTNLQGIVQGSVRPRQIHVDLQEFQLNT
jgi:hypothetical protein